MNEFFAMGGYAQYVWPSFGLTFAIVLFNVYLARRALAQARASAKRRTATMPVDQGSTTATSGVR
jgi:heme exporter protein CcmD